MIKKKIFILFILIISIIYWYSTYTANLQTSLAKKVIRLHVIANSNSSFDQVIKLAVRDEIVNEISPLLRNSSSVDESRQTIISNLPLIEKKANAVLSDYVDDRATVAVAKSKFPIKKYNNISFPAGEYESLKITIGSGKGENWWCVMFPPLCFTGSSVEFDDESVSVMKENLSDKEYELISKPDKPDVKIKFKLLELLNN